MSIEYHPSRRVVVDANIKNDMVQIGVRKLECDTGVNHHRIEKILRDEPVRRKTFAELG